MYMYILNSPSPPKYTLHVHVPSSLHPATRGKVSPYIAVSLHVFKELFEQLDREAHVLHPEVVKGDEGRPDELN